MEQYTSFNQLHEAGRSVDEIADYYGITPLIVKRVLALANLIEPIRKAYSEDDIDRETIRTLTLATKDQQAEWFALFQGDDRAPRGRSCRAWITGGDVITTDKALFDIADYEGRITADLFGEHGVFADPEVFWAAQSKAVASQIETYLSDGWTEVMCLERGAFFHRWDHVTRAKTKGGQVYVELRHDGTVTFHEGYVTETEARKLDRAERADTENAPATVKPDMSGPLAEYVLLHRHAAAQASLAHQPAIALRLMVAHAMTGSALWQVRAHECRTKKEATRKSLNDTKAASELNLKRARVVDLFKALGVENTARHNGDAYRLCELFAALLAMSDEEVGEVLALTMAETLEAGGPVIEAVLHVCETDLSAYWKPEAAFFDLCRDKRSINAMVSDIGSPSLAQSCVTDTAKVQKEIITNRINGEGCKPDPAWRPGWMRVPPTRLVEGAVTAPVNAWERIRSLFEQRPESDDIARAA